MGKLRPILLLALLPIAARAAPESFLYQLEDLDVASVTGSAYDVLVTDVSRDGTESGHFTAEEVVSLREGGRRTVLCYLSIGEAEDYRYYWDPAFKKSPPAWLGPENPDWRGNYKVRYQDPAWRAVLFGTAGDDGSYLDRILARGFDGVYLDIVDAYEFWGTDGRDMADLVIDLATYARARRPGFLVFVQNAPELGERYADYLETVSGLGVEDTWFTGNRRNRFAVTGERVAWIDRFRDAGKTVLAVDYPKSRRKVDEFYARAQAKGFVPLAARRALDRMPENGRHIPGAGPALATLFPGDDAAADAAPEFAWRGTDGAVEYRVSFSGEPSLRKVKSFRWTDAESWTPSRRQWKKIGRLAAKYGHGATWWWVTARDGEGRLRSDRARVLRLH